MSMEQVTQQLRILEIPQLWIRLVGLAVCIVLLAFFINPMLLGVRHAGCYTGCILTILGGAFFLWNAPISAFLGRMWENSHGRIVLCIVSGLLSLCVILAIAVSAGMCKAMWTAPKSEHTVVVLGCKVRGTSPSLMLRCRLDAACAYLEEHPDVPVIVCGGQGADEGISEAQCMAEYLEGKGISPERIHREDKSVSTRENLTNAKEILEANEWDSEITIVTDGFHELRASLIAGDLGLKASAVPARTPWYLVPSYWVREWLGVADFFVFG